jgi:hypothetical protein
LEETRDVKVEETRDVKLEETRDVKVSTIIAYGTNLRANFMKKYFCLKFFEQFGCGK